MFNLFIFEGYQIGVVYVLAAKAAVMPLNVHCTVDERHFVYVHQLQRVILHRVAC